MSSMTRKPVSTAVATALAGSLILSDNTAIAQQLEEIVVTASRRETSVQDVPYNIAVISGSQLENARVSGMSDFVRMVPGLFDVDTGPAQLGLQNKFILRGLNVQRTGGTGGTQTVAPVSTYVGDSPVFFNLILKDIERVEVLRGPQGTLYGSGAAGGTIRFLPRQPVFGRYAADLSTSVGQTAHSDDTNWTADGMLNLPLGDNAALRLVGGIEEFGGFIDARGLVAKEDSSTFAEPIRSVATDITSGFVTLPEQKDTNDSREVFLRTSLRWEPTDKLALSFNYLLQNSEVDDQQFSNPDFDGATLDYSERNFPGNIGPTLSGIPGGGYWPNGASFVPGGGDYAHTQTALSPYERTVDMASVEASYDFGFATLTSISTKFVNEALYVTDNTGAYVSIARPDGGSNVWSFYEFYPRGLAVTENANDDDVFTQEIRLVSNWDRTWDFVVGGYYEDRKQLRSFYQINPGITAFSQDPAVADFHASPDAEVPDLNWDPRFDMAFNDLAVFGEVTHHLTDAWDLTGGVRAFWQDFESSYVQTLQICGAFCGDGVSPNQNLGTASGFVDKRYVDQVFKLNVSYSLNDTTNSYFTWAEGFRRGSGSTTPVAGRYASLPQFQTVAPDIATNYELGLKGTIGNRFRYTAAIFRIVWEEFQFEASNPSAFPALYNGNEAESEGIELELNGQLGDSLRFTAGYSYTKAEVSKDFTIFDLPTNALLTGADPVPHIQGFKGDPLPGVPEHSFSASVDYLQPLSTIGDGNWSILWYLDTSYRSEAQSTFNEQEAFGRFFYEIDSINMWNARVMLDGGSGWAVDLTVRNLTDELGRTGGATEKTDSSFWATQYVARPRTVTLGFHYSWE